MDLHEVKAPDGEELPFATAYADDELVSAVLPVRYDLTPNLGDGFEQMAYGAVFLSKRYDRVIVIHWPGKDFFVTKETTVRDLYEEFASFSSEDPNEQRKIINQFERFKPSGWRSKIFRLLGLS